jgi:hypothetical protein
VQRKPLLHCQGGDLPHGVHDPVRVLRRWCQQLQIDLLFTNTPRYEVVYPGLFVGMKFCSWVWCFVSGFDVLFLGLMFCFWVWCFVSSLIFCFWVDILFLGLKFCFW